MALATRVEPANAVVLQIRPAITFTEDEFFAFCQLNSDWRIERTAEGAWEIMAPAGGNTSRRNLLISAQVADWASRDGTGVAYDSSAGFLLPNGAVRSPDTAWLSLERFHQLTQRERERFLPLCPDFVIELRSPSDTMPALRAKMEEYRANGARLGWLIDPMSHRVEVYRPGEPVQTLEAPEKISGEALLSGFELNLSVIWNDEL